MNKAFQIPLPNLGTQKFKTEYACVKIAHLRLFLNFSQLLLPCLKSCLT